MSLGTNFLNLLKTHPERFDVCITIFVGESIIRICDLSSGAVVYVTQKGNTDGSLLYSSPYFSFGESEQIYKQARLRLTKQKKYSFEDLIEIYGAGE